MSKGYNKTLLAALVMGAGLLPTQAAAQNITGPSQIVNATSGIANGNSTFPLQQIRDGNKSELNGFQGRDNATGWIKFDLDKAYTLNQFFLWNDINVRAEGIQRFSLTFLDGSGNPISTSPAFSAKPGRTPGQAVNLSSYSPINPVQIFDFPAVAGVKSVRLNVLSLLGQDNTFRSRVEIREVAFNGPSGSGGADAMRCYDVMRRGATKQESFTMVDQFGQSQTLVGHAVELCNPVTLNERGVTPARMAKEFKDHLVCYEIFDRQTRDRLQNVRVTNKLGAINLTTGHADKVCVVSDKRHLQRAQPAQRR